MNLVDVVKDRVRKGESEIEWIDSWSGYKTFSPGSTYPEGFFFACDDVCGRIGIIGEWVDIDFIIKDGRRKNPKKFKPFAQGWLDNYLIQKAEEGVDVLGQQKNKGVNHG